MYACMHMRAQHARTQTSTHTHSTHTYSHNNACMHAHTYTTAHNTHIRIHSHTNTHTHKYTHTMARNMHLPETHTGYYTQFYATLIYTHVHADSRSRRTNTCTYILAVLCCFACVVLLLINLRHRQMCIGRQLRRSKRIE